MNVQEAFDKSARHLLTQADKAMVGNHCRYRTRSGKSCAIGCLIPDELYRPGLEGRSAAALLEQDVTIEIDGFTKYTHIPRKVVEGLRVLFSEIDDLFMYDLQSVHDNHQPDTWKSELRQLAYSFGLDDSVLNEFSE